MHQTLQMLKFMVIFYTKQDVLPQSSWSTKAGGSVSVWHWVSIAWLQPSPRGGESRDRTCTRPPPWEGRAGEETTTAASSLSSSQGQWSFLILMKYHCPLLVLKSFHIFFPSLPALRRMTCCFAHASATVLCVVVQTWVFPQGPRQGTTAAMLPYWKTLPHR